MAPPTLYHVDLSPPCRFVRLVASVAEVELNEIELEDLYQDTKRPEMLKKNPQHSVPMLEDNGLCIAESRAIATYLISKYAQDDSLYPEDVNKRAVVDQRLYFDFEIFARLRKLYIPKLMGDQVMSSDIDKLKDGLEILNRMLEGRQWLAGDNVTIADYAFANSLTTLTLAPESGVDIAMHSNIAEWTKRVEASHPKCAELLSDYRKGLQLLLQGFPK